MKRWAVWTSVVVSILALGGGGAPPAGAATIALDGFKSTARNAVQVDVADLFGRWWGLYYQRSLRDWFSIRVGVAYTYRSRSMTLSDHGPGLETGNGVSGQIEPAWHFLGAGLNGPFISLVARIGGELDVGFGTRKGLSYLVGSTLGWAWVLGPVSLRVGITPAQYDKDITETMWLLPGETHRRSSGFALLGTLSIGAAF